MGTAPFSLVLVAGMIIGMRIQSAAPPMTVIKSDDLAGGGVLGAGKIEELIRYIEAKYVDSVDREKLVNEAIDHLLEQLDPHSTYLTAEQLQEVSEQLDGNFEGIGIEFMILDDTIRVISPLSGGPSEAVGILPGDRIVEIEDSIVAGVQIDTDQIMEKLRGNKGTEVEVGILRGHEQKVRHFTITRDRIPVHSVDVAYMLDEKTGYVKISRFSATTSTEFLEAIGPLVENHSMQDLVIDLRQNPGGHLREATDVLSQLFRERDKLLVYTEGNSVNRQEYKTTGRALYNIKDLAILIDEGSASASEILAGAIQDQDRGVIIGRRSFGKGLVQEQYRLRDGSAIRLTVARYYIPSNRSIQKNYEDRTAYSHDVLDRYESGELYSRDSIHLSDTTTYLTASGRKVFGGGGIIPDVFVPLDTSYLNDAFFHLRPLIPSYVFRYYEDHRADLAGYDLASFRRGYQADERFWQNFLAFANDGSADYPASELATAKPRLLHLLKARLAKHLFEDVGYYTVLNDRDEDVQKAIEMLHLPNPLTEN